MKQTTATKKTMNKRKMKIYNIPRMKIMNNVPKKKIVMKNPKSNAIKKK